MRRSSVILSAVLTTGFVGAIWGCGDLLHSTDFTSDKTDTINTAPVNFCQWSLGEAQEHAVHACTMLLSCQNGLSADAPNALGECIKRANLAYNCNVAPNRPVNGDTRKLWDCLWRAKSCVAPDPTKENDVASCMKNADGNPPPALCGEKAGFVRCDGPLRTECRTANAPGNFDPCVASGRTCVSTGDKTSCAGSSNPACTKTGCEGTKLHWCVDGGPPQDHGVDCADFGAGVCDDPGDGGNPTCRLSPPPLPDAGPAAPDASAGPACTPTPKVQCEQNVAIGCPSGIQERVDCGLLGLPCTTTEGGDAFDVARACGSPAATCTDSCVGTKLHVCLRGGRDELEIDCKAHGLKDCVKQVTSDGKEQATCGGPLP